MVGSNSLVTELSGLEDQLEGIISLPDWQGMLEDPATFILGDAWEEGAVDILGTIVSDYLGTNLV